MDTDFSKITPCGGNCSDCKHFIDSDCEGCLTNGGICISMWENACEIFKCCERNGAKFCGLCEKFPCEWIENKLGEWNSGGVEKQKRLQMSIELCGISRKKSASVLDLSRVKISDCYMRMWRNRRDPNKFCVKLNKALPNSQDSSQRKN